MSANKPSVTKIETADRVNVLHSMRDMRHFMIVTKKTVAFRHRN